MVRILALTCSVSSLTLGVVWACGPFIIPFPTVSVVDPADPKAFARGEIGVVRPRYRRVTLAMAFRTLSEHAPLEFQNDASYSAWPDDHVWREISARVLGADNISSGPPRTRRLEDYASPLNCLQAGYDTAVHTFGERQSLYGNDSSQLTAWVKAQAAVFANCEEVPLSLPEPAAASADALTKADRAYQTAAAYFYGMQYDEAERRFRAIGDDSSSPWRPYGRYLAARSMLRLGTMGAGSDEAKQQALRDAERELIAVSGDPIATPVHSSARGLLRFVRLRLRPAEELRALSTRIASSTDVMSNSELADFAYLLDQRIGNTIDFDYSGVAELDSLRGSHDLVDWVIAMQGAGDAARDRAISRWRETHSVPWLVAALSHLRGAHDSAQALLDAAAAVPPSSPAFATLAFQRVRLMIALGQVDTARRLLATLPDQESKGASRETINLYRAERLMVASTLAEFLVAAPRRSLEDVEVAGSTRSPLASFDEDAATVFTDRMPLDQLIESALSTALPPRLRTRVAIAGFTRAVLLDRHESARKVAPVLQTLAPELAADLTRYLKETTPAGQGRAAILLILRTPGMTTVVRGLDDSYSVDFVEPRRKFESFVPTWWCGASDRTRARGEAASELIHTLYPDHSVPYPAFITADGRSVVERELAALDATGPAARFLATAALEWARERPTDPDAAEALARIVNGWRRSCRDESDAELSRLSFQALHRLFPESEWAKRTKYWYR